MSSPLRSEILADSEQVTFGKHLWPSHAPARVDTRLWESYGPGGRNWSPRHRVDSTRVAGPEGVDCSDRASEGRHREGGRGWSSEVRRSKEKWVGEGRGGAGGGEGGRWPESERREASGRNDTGERSWDVRTFFQCVRASVGVRCAEQGLLGYL